MEKFIVLLRSNVLYGTRRYSTIEALTISDNEIEIENVLICFGETLRMQLLDIKYKKKMLK